MSVDDRNILSAVKKEANPTARDISNNLHRARLMGMNIDKSTDPTSLKEQHAGICTQMSFNNSGTESYGLMRKR